MKKRLTRIGNSLGLVLDRPLLERLGIDAKTQLEVSTDGGVIVIAPARAKRTGLAAAVAFLGINRFRIVASDEELIELTLGVAKGEVTKAAVAEFLRAHCKPW